VNCVQQASISSPFLSSKVEEVEGRGGGLVEEDDVVEGGTVDLVAASGAEEPERSPAS